jgi:DNA-binding CsgD family transcriptional regulator
LLVVLGACFCVASYVRNSTYIAVSKYDMKQLIPASDYKMAMKRVAIVTEREVYLVKELASGKNIGDIARLLGRSKRTIEVGIYRLQKKTGCRKAPLLVAAFKDQGLI